MTTKSMDVGTSFNFESSTKIFWNADFLTTRPGKDKLSFFYIKAKIKIEKLGKSFIYPFIC